MQLNNYLTRVNARFIFHTCFIDYTCVLCTQNESESEYHFLLCCPLYKELRTKYNITYSWPNLNMFTNIMSNYTASSVNDISKFFT